MLPSNAASSSTLSRWAEFKKQQNLAAAQQRAQPQQQAVPSEVEQQYPQQQQQSYDPSKGAAYQQSTTQDQQNAYAYQQHLEHAQTTVPQQQQYAAPYQQQSQQYLPQHAWGVAQHQVHAAPQTFQAQQQHASLSQVQHSWQKSAEVPLQEAAPPLPDEPPPEDPGFSSSQSWAEAIPAQQHSAYAAPAQAQTQAPGPWNGYTQSHTYQHPYTHMYPQHQQHQPAGYSQHPWQAQAQPTHNSSYQAPWQQTHAALSPLYEQPQLQAHLASPQPVRSPTPPPVNLTPAKEIFLPPARVSRPKRIVIIMRGLPGSGKTHAARALREVEAQHGSEAPRIHGIDDYFVTEVEKEIPAPNGKGKRQKVREMEYCYEPELEGRYKQSLYKAFKRTVDEGRFKMVIVDAPNVRVEDFKDYWAAGQRGGYEVYVMQPLVTDPEACHKRNIHTRTLEDITAMAKEWEPTPIAYPQIDIAPLLTQKDEPPQEVIAEVEMEEDVEVHSSAAQAVTAAADDDNKVAAKVTSRWNDGEAAQEQSKVKRTKRSQKADTSAVQPSVPASVGPKSILKAPAQPGTGVGPHKGRISWAGEPDEDAGFSVGGPRQLETVYVLSGLGPAKADSSTANADGPSFAAQAKKDRASEQQMFRSLLLGAGHH